MPRFPLKQQSRVWRRRGTKEGGKARGIRPSPIGGRGVGSWKSWKGVSQFWASWGVVFGPPGEGTSSTFLRGERGGGQKAITKKNSKGHQRRPKISIFVPPPQPPLEAIKLKRGTIVHKLLAWGGITFLDLPGEGCCSAPLPTYAFPFLRRSNRFMVVVVVVLPSSTALRSSVSNLTRLTAGEGGRIGGRTTEYLAAISALPPLGSALTFFVLSLREIGGGEEGGRHCECEQSGAIL